MKNFLIYDFLLPCLLSCALVLPICAVHACVTVRGDTYTVDGYGAMTPSKDEMDASSSNRGSRNYREQVQFDSVNIPSFKSPLGQYRAQY